MKKAQAENPAETLPNDSHLHSLFVEQVVTTRANKSRRVQTINHSTSKTQQAFKDECDINNIIRKYKENPDSINRHIREHGSYADLTNITDLQTAMDSMLQAQSAFDALPSAVRKQYNNDPLTFVNAISDPSQTETLIKLGILEQTQPEPAHTSPQREPNATPTDPPKSSKAAKSTSTSET